MKSAQKDQGQVEQVRATNALSPTRLVCFCGVFFWHNPDQKFREPHARQHMHLDIGYIHYVKTQTHYPSIVPGFRVRDGILVSSARRVYIHIYYTLYMHAYVGMYVDMHTCIAKLVTVVEGGQRRNAKRRTKYSETARVALLFFGIVG